jgi:thioredoxin reductase (NADPH)
MTTRAFDIVVVGAGPAGLAAARAAVEGGLSAIAIDRMGPGGELINLGELLGIDAAESGATGPDLVARLTEEAMTAGVELAIDEVRSAVPGQSWLVEGLEDRFSAAALIVAAGLMPGTTGLPDEAAFVGLGLSHCAHCDAPLYEGKSVVVAGDDMWAVEEAIHLAGHADRVTLVSTATPDAPPERLAELMGLPNVTRLEGRIAALAGDDGLERVTIEGEGAGRTVAAHGLFLQIGRQPARDFLDTAHESAAGLFWAGDIRPGSVRTVAEAIADGARAGHNAAAWVRARQSA